ncbi:MAG: hypothetical protein Q4P20_05440 [Eubacteriales bacterium]|nr:hypothetical protein [Eubacteriales bacterium]
MKSKTVSHILFTLIFIGILFGTLFTLVLKPKRLVSYYENRNLATIPEFSVSSLWDGSYFAAWETYLSDHAVGRETLLHLHTQTDLDVLHRPMVNDIIASEDDKLLAFYVDPPKTDEDVAAASSVLTEQCAAINKQIQSYGGTFLFASVPGQTSYYADSYPWYLSDTADQFELHRDVLAADLKANGVPFLDIGKYYDSLGHPVDFYSSTDHHYTYRGAFAAYQDIMQQINALTGDDLKIYTEDELEFRTLPNHSLGSRARKLYSVHDNAEERLTISSFKQPVAFRRYDNGTEVAASCYTLPANDTTEISYTIYMGGDQAETVIQTDRPELPNILIVGDSYTNALETLLYASFNEMRSLDLRHYQEKPLSEYIADYQPDIVLYLRDYGSLLSAEGNGTLK